MIDLRPDFLDTLKRLLAEIVPDCEVRIFGPALPMDSH